MNFSKWNKIIIKPRGRIVFRYNKECENNYEMDIIEYDEIVREMRDHSLIGDLMRGHAFLNAVEEGYLIDYDGSLGKVYICGYESNLGLSCNMLHQGDFQVDGDTWKQLCDEFDVMVEWCNK